MKITERLYVTDRDDWCAWLRKNHDSKSELWVIFHKTHAGKPVISYNDAVEEALCFGWIDSIVQKIDEEKFARKFTPRKGKSRWSETNKRRARKMIKQGRMTEAGLVESGQRRRVENCSSLPRPEKSSLFRRTLKKHWRQTRRL